MPQDDGSVAAIVDELTAALRDAGLLASGERLLAALLPARVDGEPPVEYLTDDRRTSFVRGFARSRLADKTLGFVGLRQKWWEGISLL